MRYEDVVRAALKTDPDFVTLCKTLYGDEIAKDGPDCADVHVPGNDGTKKRKKTIPVIDNRGVPELEKRYGIPTQPRDFHRDDHGRFSSFATAAAHAGVAGLAGSGSLVAGQKTATNSKHLVSLVSQLRQSQKGRRALLTALASHGGKTAALAAVGGVAGAAAAHHGRQAYGEIRDRANLERQHKAEVKHVTRELDLHEMADGEPSNATVITHNPNKGPNARTTIRRDGAKQNLYFGKRDVDMTGAITGINEDKHQVFGWASIVQKNGEPVVDLQGDYIGVDELEKAAYDYVQNSRIGGAMHYRVDEDGNLLKKNAPYHAADLIESFVVTPEKIEKMGLPESTPVGWWVGFKVNDPEVWDAVKSGDWKGFSIHGSGRRTEKSMEDLNLTGAELTRG